MIKTITLKKNEDRRIQNGHLWAFSNEIAKIEGEPKAGDIVELHNHAGNFIGKGFFNPSSLIAVRLLTRHKEETIDFEYFRKRIASSLQLRRQMYPDAESFRIVHGEADFLPGLIIDKYNDFVSLQAFSYGMDSRLTLICDVIDSLLHPGAIIERNETIFRQLEGLEQKKGLLRGSGNETVITENGIKYKINLLDGQKTGFFLDQRENRKAFRRYVKGCRVLDCFCNDGGFALNAAFAEASEVIGVDVSQAAVNNASGNAKLNNLDHRARFIAEDAFEYLKSAALRSEKLDVIALDPPSFAKNKKTVRRAQRGYKELHTLALSILKPNGILATASCSHHIYEETFIEIINTCARAAGRDISLLEWHGASLDHPVLPTMPETKYLKFGIFRVI
ncbi:MAG TPA: class I SAM-dependent rRNA methyltransferase [Bacteroidota bacterium]|jgi:23S rRNA (cytosine1962-C5)-methyltransferase|nr:class I SAM-dependent rRNA methyltransferase [Bacteroidota bacterium]